MIVGIAQMALTLLLVRQLAAHALEESITTDQLQKHASTVLLQLIHHLVLQV